MIHRTDETLLNVLTDIKVSNPEEKLKSLFIYMDKILEYNKSINLTAITDRDDFILKNLVDSLTCAYLEQFLKSDNIIDIGTGAGFPGLVLAIAFPEKNFILLDSLKKRLKILDEIIETINLKNVRTIHDRAEQLAHDKKHREKYDFAVARAVAPLNVLSEYCLPFVRVNGYFAAMKGKKSSTEINGALKAFKILGGSYAAAESTIMREFGYEHSIILINKVKPTSEKYPRRAGTPESQPL